MRVLNKPFLLAAAAAALPLFFIASAEADSMAVSVSDGASSSVSVSDGPVDLAGASTSVAAPEAVLADSATLAISTASAAVTSPLGDVASSPGGLGQIVSNDAAAPLPTGVVGGAALLGLLALARSRKSRSAWA